MDATEVAALLAFAFFAGFFALALRFAPAAHDVLWRGERVGEPEGGAPAGAARGEPLPPLRFPVAPAAGAAGPLDLAAD